LSPATVVFISRVTGLFWLMNIFVVIGGMMAYEYSTWGVVIKAYVSECSSEE